MFQEIKAWCKQCEWCCLRKTPTANVRAPLVSIHTSAPMELVCTDYLSLEKSKGGIENVLIVRSVFKIKHLLRTVLNCACYYIMRCRFNCTHVAGFRRGAVLCEAWALWA